MDIDIDNEFDGRFLDQFRSMGTTDRDVLIAEFQAILGNQINPESCAFFLEMNNWNLQNAVCSYYDFNQPTNILPSMSLVADVTIGDGESVAPCTTFVKTWRIKNPGLDRWPPGCHFRFCSGDNMSTVERRMVEALSPGEEINISIEMRSPSLVGNYHGVWRMCTPTGTYFGDVINIHVNVAEGGLLGLTQQLSRIGGATGQISGGPDGQINIFSVQGQNNSSSMETSALQQQPNISHTGDPTTSSMQSHVSENQRCLEGSTLAVEDDTEMS